MRLPETILMRAVMFGDGENGAAWQRSRNDEFGVQCDSLRPDRDSSFRDHWTSDHLPAREFDHYRELRAALMPVKKKAAYPALVLKVYEPHPATRSSCDLCHDGACDWHISAKVGWRASDIINVSSCKKCLPKVKKNPVAAQDARIKWVKENPPPFLQKLKAATR
jgi:hypothetical protein